MTEVRERIPVVVMLIIAMIGFIIVYLLMVPPQTAYNLISGNITTPAPANVTPSHPPGSFYYPFTSYIGGISSGKSFNYQIGTFGVSYLQKNVTLLNKTQFSLSASIFGSSSYTINFNGSQSDQYLLVVHVASVSGNPRLTVSLNGNKFASNILSSGSVLYLELPTVSNKSNSLSMVVSINGFAFWQSASFSSVAFVQSTSNLAANIVPVKVLTLSGLGLYTISYSPIGTGNLNITVNNNVISQISSGSDSTENVTIPQSVVSAAIPQSSSVVLPVTFNVGFVPSKGVHYEISNAELVYSLPQIKYNNVTFPFSVVSSSTEYESVFYLNQILYSGSVTFSFYPSGYKYTIPSSNLTTGENVMIFPSYYLSGNNANGNYTGTITVSTNGLIIPQYLSISTFS